LTDFTDNFWETTYRQQIGKMIGICYRYVASRQVAEDLAHDAFIKAIDNSASFKGKGSFESWLRRIVVNVALHYLRDQKRIKHLNDWMLNQNVEMETPSHNTNKDLINRSDFSEEELLDAINCLPEHHRLVFNLYVIDKFTHAQIGEELGISPGTSKSHLARARKKLRKLLYQRATEEPDKRKRKRALLLLVFPVKLRFIDRLCQRSFLNFEMQPQNPDYINSINLSKASLPTFKPLLFSFKFFLIIGISIGVVTVAVILGKKLLNQKKITINKTEIADSVHQEYIANNPNLNKESLLINSDPKTATISLNSIILNSNHKKNISMKNLSHFGALLLTASGIVLDSSGQVKYENIDEFGIYRDSWALVEKNNLKGFIDTSGKVIVEVKYDEIYEFDEYLENWALVEKDNLKGFIDTSGKEIVETKYDEISEFDEIKNGWMLVEKDGLWGAIDRNGQEVLKTTYKETEIIKDEEENELIGNSTGSKNIFNVNPTDSCIINAYWDNDDKKYIVNGNKDELFNWINEKDYVYLVSTKKGINFSNNAFSTSIKLTNYQIKERQGQFYINNKKVGTVQKGDIIILYHEKKIDVYNREKVKIME